MDNTIVFGKMNEDEFRRFEDKNIKDYAQTLIKGRGFDEKTALTESEKEFKSMLPDGLHTKDQFLMFIENAQSGTPVGEIWFGYEEEDGERQVFLAEFLIYEEYRRKGCATSALSEMERLAKADGCAVSALYVWDHNPGAYKLYEKCGYATVSHGNGGSYMKKRL